MNRELAINLLVDNDLNDWQDRDDRDEYFSYMLRNGLKGYNELTDEELEDELYDRDLLDDFNNRE